MNAFRLAAEDFRQALLRYPLWVHLGIGEIRQRYQRSVLGPWWISLSMLIFICVMSAVFSRLFHQTLRDYIPFFTAGFLFWTFLSSSITEATEVFRSNSSFIKQVNLPYNLYVFKHLFRQTIYLAHNLVVYLLVCAFFKIIPSLAWFLLLPGFIVLVANLYWISLLIGLMSTRFRDIAPIISSAIQVAFFVTPISWMPKLLDGYPYLLKLNPFTYLLDLVRSPLLGQNPVLMSWVVGLSMAFVGFLLCFVIFAKTRLSLVFWVD